MLRNSRKFIALLGAFLIGVSAHGQHTQSSYTTIGVGDINYGALTQNSSMGGVGLSYNSKYFVNLLNPALFGMNDNAVFHIGGTMDFRTYANPQQSYTSNTGGFKDFALSLPIVPQKWNMGLGLTPLSGVKYAYTTRGIGPESTVAVSEFSGDGGLDEFFITNGFKLGNLYLGAKMAIVIGAINKNSSSFLEGNTNTAFGRTVVNERQSFSDVRYQLGAAYKLKLSENSFLNFGATFDPETKISAKQLRLLDQQSAGGNIFSRDTLLNALDRKVQLPSRIGFGLSYEKYQRFNFGIDFHTSDGTSFRNIDGEADPNMGKGFRVAAGGEIIPNGENTGFLGLISYRFGVHFEKTPYLVNNQKVNDLGISFGTSLPLSAVWGLSTVNIGATIGRRGSLDNGLIRENYVKLNFGFSVQDITWFTRSKFN